LKKIEEFDYNSTKLIIDSLPEDKKELCTGLYNELLFMQKTLNNLKENIEADGVVVEMCQGKYSISRSNPSLATYNTMIKNYSSVIKQLNEILEKVESPDSDDFDEF